MELKGWSVIAGPRWSAHAQQLGLSLLGFEGSLKGSEKGPDRVLRVSQSDPEGF